MNDGLCYVVSSEYSFCGESLDNDSFVYAPHSKTPPATINTTENSRSLGYSRINKNSAVRKSTRNATTDTMRFTSIL